MLSAVVHMQGEGPRPADRVVVVQDALNPLPQPSALTHGRAPGLSDGFP